MQRSLSDESQSENADFESNPQLYDLKEQATGLISQPLNAQQNAGPAFEYPVN